MVDYLFLYTDIPRITVCTDARNIAAIEAAKRAGFKRAGFKVEGIVRKGGFAKGKFVDACLLSLLIEEWKEPKILTKTT